MGRTLYSWVGYHDIKGARDDRHGALSRTAEKVEPTRIVLLVDPQPEDDIYGSDSLTDYVEWLRGRTEAEVVVLETPLTTPMHFGEIYAGARRALRQHQSEERIFNLSSGTGAMTAVWVLLGRGPFPARLMNSSIQEGVVEAEVPFDVVADFVPDVRDAAAAALSRVGGGQAPRSSAFSDILHQSSEMREVIARAVIAAQTDLPVLITGESGTGKELMAKAIHQGSSRSRRQPVVVNCGAIPGELVESTLFGYVKGAFTGAVANKEGAFQEANGSTLFLDEVGELALDAQVKLLRALQEGEVSRVGELRTRRVDVRIVAATHRDLPKMVQDGTFREDLYYRLAVATLHIPPLRSRPDDLQLLVDDVLQRLNRDVVPKLGYGPRSLTVAALKKLRGHTWSGNVRELQNTLTRAVLFSRASLIDAVELELHTVRSAGGGVLNRPVAGGVDLQSLLREVELHYIERALEHTNGSKAAAERLLGLGRGNLAYRLSRQG